MSSKEVESLLRKQFIIDILVACQEETNIRQLSKTINLSYANTIRKIKELKELNLIETRREGKDTKIVINKSWLKDFIAKNTSGGIRFDPLHKFEQHKAFLEKVKKNYNEKEEVIKFLELLNAERFSPAGEVERKIRKELKLEEGDYMYMRDFLEYGQILRQKIELTKKGKRLLKELKKIKP